MKQEQPKPSLPLEGTVRRAPSETSPVRVKSARFMQPTHWGPLGGDLIIKETKKFDMHYSVLGLHIKLVVDGTSVIIPAANVRFVEEM